MTEVLNQIPDAVTGGVGIAGLLVGLFWMLARGALVTRREVNDIRDDRDRWRAVAEVSTRQLEKVLENDVLALSILQSIDRRSAEVGNE